MKIKIKRRGRNTAILISFDTVKNKFKSASERNRFYWELHGRKQTIIKDSGRYEYEKEGLLTRTPHIRVDNSVFIIAMKHLERMMKFFEEWEDKLEFKTFPVLLNEKEVKKLEKEIEIE